MISSSGTVIFLLSNFNSLYTWIKHSYEGYWKRSISFLTSTSKALSEMIKEWLRPQTFMIEIEICLSLRPSKGVIANILVLYSSRMELIFAPPHNSSLMKKSPLRVSLYIREYLVMRDTMRPPLDCWVSWKSKIIPYCFFSYSFSLIRSFSFCLISGMQDLRWLTRYSLRVLDRNGIPIVPALWRKRLWLLKNCCSLAIAYYIDKRC